MDYKLIYKKHNQVGYFYLQLNFRYLINYLEDNCLNYLYIHYALISLIVFRSNFHDKYRMIMVKEIKTSNFLTEI